MSEIQQGQYSGDSDLRLEWISFYYHSKARDRSRLPPTVLTTLKPRAVRSLCSGPLGQRIFRPDNCLFGLSIPTDDVEGAESIRLRLQQGKNSDCLQGGSYLSLHVCTLGECTGPMQKYVNRRIQSRTRRGRCRCDQFVLSLFTSSCHRGGLPGLEVAGLVKLSIREALDSFVGDTILLLVGVIEQMAYDVTLSRLSVTCHSQW